MKTISMRELQKQLKGCLDAAQTDQIVITRHGKPAAVCIGVEGHDWETVLRATDTAFWHMIAERRQQLTLSRDELEAALQTPQSKPQRRPRR